MFAFQLPNLDFSSIRLPSFDLFERLPVLQQVLTDTHAVLALFAVHWLLILLLLYQFIKKRHTAAQLNPMLVETQVQLKHEIARNTNTEELLLQTRDYLNGLLNSLPGVIVGVNDHLQVTHWNSGAESLTGVKREEALGQSLEKLMADSVIPFDKLRRTLTHKDVCILRAIKKGIGSDATFTDLEIRPLLSAESAGAVILMQDVTLRIRVEKSLIQNEKMLSLGAMAAGLAHEINNPLAAIMSNIQNIQRRLSLSIGANLEVADAIGLEFRLLQEYLDQRDIPNLIEFIKEAGERAAKIVKTMLEFSHAHNSAFEPLDIIRLMDESLALAANTLEIRGDKGPSMPFVIRDFAPNLPWVECSASEIQQVILNILLNAAQAIHGAKTANPTITIRIKKWHESVRIEIEDNGPGIDKKVQKQIFEPFFTTKEVGAGTGLGLSVSYFIVTQHHQGTIDLESAPNAGCKFIITLPLKQPERSGEAEGAKAPLTPSLSSLGRLLQ